jgi:DNA invertase Pin-like site-specific DNA recombinase
MRLFGYARVSTLQQSLEIQKQALKKARVEYFLINPLVVTLIGLVLTHYLLK